MTGYIIYARKEFNDTIEAYEVNDIECTIEKLFDDILNINRCWQIVSFGRESLNELPRYTPLSDIGLGSESTIDIKNKKLSEDEERIIEDYSKDALEAYKTHYFLEDSDVEYSLFSNKYRGYFGHPHHFVDHNLEIEYGYNHLPWYLKQSIEMEKDYLYDVYTENTDEENGYYFWAYPSI